MSRLVQPVQTRSAGSRGFQESAGEWAGGGDEYRDRIAKYVPAEVLAAYLSLDRIMVPDVTKFLEGKKVALSAAGAAGLEPYVPVAIFLVGLIFTPLYIWQSGREIGPNTPWMTHAFIATIAFAVWAYAMQGSIFTVGLSDNFFRGNYAAALVIVFTLASGLFAPTTIANKHKL